MLVYAPKKTYPIIAYLKHVTRFTSCESLTRWKVSRTTRDMYKPLQFLSPRHELESEYGPLCKAKFVILSDRQTITGCI